MTITRLQYHKGSFEKIEFLVELETKTGGKKTVTNEYVNSDKRFTEELGILPPKFTLNIVVHGDDAITKRKQLEFKLDQPGVGSLVHPIYGEVKVKSTTYKVSSSQTSIGEFKFVVNFETSETNITAFVNIETEQKAKKDADAARKKVNDKLSEKYQELESTENTKKLGDKLNAIYDGIVESVGNVTSAVQDKVAAFNDIVDEGRSKIFSVIQKVETIKSSLEDAYASVLQIVNTPGDLVDSWKSLTDFGFVDINSIIGSSNTSTTGNSSKVNTPARIEEDVNKNLLNEHTRVTALINLMEAASFANFDTVEDISDIKKTVNDIYNNLFQDVIFTTDGKKLSDEQLNQYSPLGNDSELRDIIQTLRGTVNNILNQKSQTIWRTKSIEIGLTSISLLTYRYYGDLNNLDLISDMNKDLNVSNISGQIKVLTK